MSNYIGIIDSGIGGLTVLQGLKQILPNENYIYVGDNKHCPYGEKTNEQLLEYTSSIIDYLINRGIKLLVVACNTTSANILPELIKKYNQIKIIGVIESTVKSTIDSGTKNCLIIATPKTIEAHFYEDSINKYNKNINLFSKATPMFVPLIEKNDASITQYIDEYLNEYKNKIDTIVLGCTHYPIIKNKIKDYLGDVNIISSSEGVSLDVKNYLINNNLLNNNMGSMEIYTTGDVNTFYESSKIFFDYENIQVKHLDL